jgi:hypothetical protein
MTTTKSLEVSKDRLEELLDFFGECVEEDGIVWSRQRETVLALVRALAAQAPKPLVQEIAEQFQESLKTARVQNLSETARERIEKIAIQYAELRVSKYDESFEYIVDAVIYGARHAQAPKVSEGEMCADGMPSEEEIEKEIKRSSPHWQCGFHHCLKFLRSRLKLRSVESLREHFLENLKDCTDSREAVSLKLQAERARSEKLASSIRGAVSTGHTADFKLGVIEGCIAAYEAGRDTP